jgi:two-component system LytT family response regulator
MSRPPAGDAPLRVLIVDDEPHARAGLARLVEGTPGFMVAGECHDGRSAVRAIARDRPDLVLLDVQMPEMSGLEVIGAVGPERMPPVIFVTAFDQHAVEAFSVHALDFVLKPFDDRRFRAALERARRGRDDARLRDLGRRLLALVTGAPPPPGPPSSPGFVVTSAGRTRVVRADEVDWIEAANYCARLHVNDRVHVVRETMRALEARLDPTAFVRVHRSAIVRWSRVKELRRSPRGEHQVVLANGVSVPLSRNRWSAVAARFGRQAG